MITSLKASRFMEANQRSPVVYCSVEDHAFTYRLADGSVWTFPRREARSIEEPRWAHMEVQRPRGLIRHAKEERELLSRVEAEAALPERYAER